ncbi:MAG: hypothetical protein HYR96_08695 [Deltaproteobacteria bacterium]|nr:hypothetical protein [Deltaproteobacteria bacterium]MBI3294995.1 hypothetical protein [Deltaproteobacteria bacterium]
MGAEKHLGRYAATLTTIEVGLGSLLHSVHIPFSGNCLSLNQGFWLSRAVSRHSGEPGVRTFPARVSAISAILKSLSPTGKRLTPMLAIAAQGLLFSLGTLSLGPTLGGVTVGMLLLCLWPFLQPLLVAYLIFGKSWFEAVGFAVQQIERALPVTDQQLLMGLSLVIVIKILLGLAVVLLSRRLSLPQVEALEKRLLGLAKAKPIRLADHVSIPTALKGAAQDLLNPFFLSSLALTLLFFSFSESAHSPLIWVALRPLGAGFLLFFAIRLFPNRWLPNVVRRTLEALPQ